MQIVWRSVSEKLSIPYPASLAHQRLEEAYANPKRLVYNSLLETQNELHFFVRKFISN